MLPHPARKDVCSLDFRIVISMKNGLRKKSQHICFLKTGLEGWIFPCSTISRCLDMSHISGLAMVYHVDGGIFMPKLAGTTAQRYLLLPGSCMLQTGGGAHMKGL